MKRDTYVRSQLLRDKPFSPRDYCLVAYAPSCMTLSWAYSSLLLKMVIPSLTLSLALLCVQLVAHYRK
eukprot:3342546-Rhodomonas_salina.1